MKQLPGLFPAGIGSSPVRGAVAQTLVLALTLIFLAPSRLPAAMTPPDPAAGKLTVTSPAFDPGKTIPADYSCDGRNVSPALSWTGAPSATRSFAVIMDDPDAPAGTWVHWVYYDIPAGATGLPEGVAPDANPATGGVQGKNSFGRIGYGGPCPPANQTHRYFFKVYALDTQLGLAPGASRADVDKAIAGHILARGQLMGRFGH
jgi:Raf kinase inhibitor-like YbhB/YbcL family protein